MIDKSKNSLFDELVARLISMFGESLPPLQARAAIQDAWTEICREREWGWLRRQGKLIVPGGMLGALGSFTLASGRVDVTNAATKTFLNSVPFNLLSALGIVAPDGRWYQIERWYDTEEVLLLQTPYFGTTSASPQTFQIACAYVPSPLVKVYEELSQGLPSDYGALRPDPSFNGWLAITRGNKPSLQWFYTPLAYSPEIRLSAQPVSIHTHVALTEQSGFYDATHAGLKIDSMWFRIYPTYNGTEMLVYDVVYRSNGGTLSDDETEGVRVLPTIIPTAMLLAKAAMIVGVNQSLIPSTPRRLEWLRVAGAQSEIYAKFLSDAILQDDNLVSKDRLNNQSTYQLPFGAIIPLDNRQVILG